MIPERHVWIFVGGSPQRPGGVFTSLELAERWIKKNRLTGTLSAYPLDQGCFDWAVEHEVTNLKAEKLEAKRRDPAFIAGFSTASQEHYHYEDGFRPLIPPNISLKRTLREASLCSPSMLPARCLAEVVVQSPVACNRLLAEAQPVLPV